MKKLLPYVLAFHAALAAAILLWALQEKFPGPLTNTLSPVWNSPWEMGKAAFFPLLAAAPTLWVLQKGGSRGGLCLMALSGAALALVPADCRPECGLYPADHFAPHRRHIYPVYRGDRRHHPVLRAQKSPPWGRTLPSIPLGGAPSLAFPSRGPRC